MMVAEYEDFFLGHHIVTQQNEHYLIKLAHYGLKEDIREGLKSTEFATLGELFEEAAEVEEILEMEKSPESHRRKRKRKSRTIDPEDELPWDQPDNYKDDPETDEEDGEDEETDKDCSYEGETRIEVDSDEKTDDDLSSRGLTILEHTDDEGDQDDSGNGGSSSK